GLHHRVDRRAAVAGEREERLGLLVRVADVALGERAEERLGEEHHEGLVAQDHAGRLVVGELRVEREAELAPEGLAPREVFHREVQEELVRHVSPLSSHGPATRRGFIGRRYESTRAGRPKRGKSVSTSRKEHWPAMR